MPRSAAEIQFEATRLAQEAQNFAAAAQARLISAQQTIAESQTAANNARTAANAALAAAANDTAAAEGHCAAARAYMVAATAASTQAFSGIAGADPKDEWKECRASIGRFDQLLVDLRKTGFGFVTTVLGALALISSRVTDKPISPQFEFAAFVIIGVLVVALFAVDCTHQSWLRAAVLRAKQLESNLNYQITGEIEKTFKLFDAVLLGFVVYLLFLATNSFIFWTALNSYPPYKYWTVWGGVAGFFIMLAILAYRRWHR